MVDFPLFSFQIVDTFLDGSLELLFGKAWVFCDAPDVAGQAVTGQTGGEFMLLYTAAVNGAGFACRCMEDFTVCSVAALTHGAETAACTAVRTTAA